MEKKTERIIKLLQSAQEEFAEDHYIAVIPEIMTKKFIAYCAMKEDLDLVLKYINLLKNKPDHTISSSLTYSMIALYGKCFTDASKSNFPKLEPNTIFIGQDEYREIHNQLMDLRHQFIAHRGDTENEVGISYMSIPKENGEPQVRFRQIKLSSFSDKKLEQVEALIKFVTEILKSKIQKSGQKVYEGFFNVFTPEQMKHLVFNNTK